jgi:hypothetical protein
MMALHSTKDVLAGDSSLILSAQYRNGNVNRRTRQSSGAWIGFIPILFLYALAEKVVATNISRTPECSVLIRRFMVLREKISGPGRVKKKMPWSHVPNDAKDSGGAFSFSSTPQGEHGACSDQAVYSRQK